MTSTQTSRLEGLTTSLGMKAPVRVATTANITLSGLQTIDGVTLVEDDRVLVKNQSTASENGIYIATTGSWSRAADFNGARDCVRGTRIPVAEGSTYEGKVFYVTTANPITIGTTSLAFSADDVAAFDSISPLTTVGDVIYGGASGTGTRLAGNTATQKKALIQAGDGSSSTAPAWEQISYDDLTDKPTFLEDITGESLLDLGDVSGSPANGTQYALTYSSVGGGNFTLSTITGGAGSDFEDDVFRVSDADDTTRKIAFDAQDVSSGTVRAFRVPNQNDTLVGASSTQTLTNKTLNAPIISTISNSGTVTLPTATTTLVGRDTTDTLTNKTLTSPTISGGSVNATTLQVSGSPVITDGDFGSAGIMYSDGAGAYSSFDITAGSNITVSGGSGSDITITGGAGTGEANTASNTGTGDAGVYKTKSSVDLVFNDLVGGSNITITGGGSGGGDITITGGAGTGEANTASNVGSGTGVFKQKTSVDLEFRSLTAGSNITITGGTNDITITGGAGGAGDAWSDPVDADIVPDADSARDLGSSANRFALAYADSIYGSYGEIQQAGADQILDGYDIPWDLVLDNPALVVSGYDTSNNSGTVNYAFFSQNEKASGNTHSVAIGGHTYASGTNNGIWAATFNVTQASGGSGTFGLNGVEVAVRNSGTNTAGATGYGFIGVAMGDTRNAHAFQCQSNTDKEGGGTAASAQWTRGFVVDNTVKNSCTASCFYSSSSTATYGIDFQSCSFGTAAINIEGGTCTYGVRVTGTKTIGYEHGGSGATAGFRAQGGGTAAFAVGSGTSYTYGLDFSSATFSGGYILAHGNIEIFNTGVINYKYALSGSAGSLVGYLPIAVSGTARRIPVYAV